METGKLLFFTGKMGAGKSTYARRLASEQDTVLMSEDDILATLYPSEIKSIPDYVTYSNRIKPFIMQQVKHLTSAGITVIMDFPGNTKLQRKWFLQLIEYCNVEHSLYYIKMSDEDCIKNILVRREQEPERHEFDNIEMFEKITKYFQEPSIEEGFRIELITKENFQK